MDFDRLAGVCALLHRRRTRRRTQRRFWVHPIRQSRKVHGEFHRLVQELRFDDALFQQYFRLNKAEFDRLLTKLGPVLTRRTTSREPIGAAERLAICLRYLATGDSFTTIGFSYRVGACTVGIIVEEVCRAIWGGLVDDFMPVPTKQDWKCIAQGFLERWNFPNCLGSIDGKHVVIQAPPNSGSLFHNYKGAYSIVLLAVVDADYRFRVIDVGGYGCNSDGGTLANSVFGQALQDGTLDLPEDSPIVAAEGYGSLPYAFVGDEAFPLRRNLLRPFPGRQLPRDKRIFNYRLSRARLTVECAFGILSSQWRMYRRVLGIGPEKAELCVKATCILHNYLRMVGGGRSHQRPSQDEASAALLEAPRAGSNNATREAIRCRERYMMYFTNEGVVPWQHHVV
ncbi:hypothetical protein ACEWY4_006161 [Coilia grayii]|uniref:DDE Tnp4 domain-containing protein n=1 Tax=Coilia grayii TaxID=363190 RepID=A0ABD1KCX8_9TELE